MKQYIETMTESLLKVMWQRQEILTVLQKFVHVFLTKRLKRRKDEGDANHHPCDSEIFFCFFALVIYLLTVFGYFTDCFQNLLVVLLQ